VNLERQKKRPLPIMRNIIIVGFMATGKTTVAKALAKKLGRTYVSIDDEIEKRSGNVISDIFKNKGEAYFRKLEREIIESVSEKNDQVIDTGGGAVLDKENMVNFKKNGVVICLWSPPGVIFERTRKSIHRPLLNVEDPANEIKKLSEARRPFYKKADFHIDTADFDIKAIVKKISEIID